MDVELIQQANAVLGKCGRPQVKGALAVPIVRGFYLPITIAAGATQILTKEITGETTWRLMAISCTEGMGNALTGIRIQVRLPNGRFLIGGPNGQDIANFAWVGSWRYGIDPGVDCNPGEKLEVTIWNNGGAFAGALLFEGAHLFYLKGTAPDGPVELASQLPRYQGIVAENILSPCWQQGEGPQTPAGHSDDFFVYSSPQVTVDVAGTAPNTYTTISIDTGLDFVCRRVLVEVSQDNTVTAGLFLGRVRTASHFLSDQLCDFERYLSGAPLGKDWVIESGDLVYIDLALASALGTGNMYVTVHLEGARRRKAA